MLKKYFSISEAAKSSESNPYTQKLFTYMVVQVIASYADE
jgi:hypothetical protein